MKEKIAFVTGANKGIGFGIAKHLGLSGWQVIIGARDEQRAEKAVSELRSAGVDVLGWVNLELRNLASIDEAAKVINEQYAGLTLLVNNAGIPGDMSVNSEHTELSDIKETLDVNFIGTFALTKALIPLLTKNEGRIANDCSLRSQSLLASFGLCGQQGCSERDDGCDGYRVPAEQYPAGDILRSPWPYHHRPEWKHGAARFPRYRDGRKEVCRAN